MCRSPGRRGAGQGRSRGPLPLGPAPDGVARGHASLAPAVHARPRDAGHGRALGAGATGFAAGDAVLVYGPWGCGACSHAPAARRTSATTGSSAPGAGCGLGYDGGLAEYLFVPSHAATSSRSATSTRCTPRRLTDAALTPYHALKPRAAAARARVAVARHRRRRPRHDRRPASARAFAGADRRDRSARAGATARAATLGADAALDADGLHAADVRAELGGGATLVLDFVGNDATLALAAETIAHRRPRRASSASAAGRSRWRSGRCRSSGRCGGRAGARCPSCTRWSRSRAAGAIEIEVERAPLDDALEGYRRLHDGEVEGRAVVVP